MPFERKVDDPEKALVKDFKARIDSAKEDNKERFNKFEQWRIKYEGFCGADRKGEKVRTNLIFSTMQTVMPRVYAKNPDIAVTPGEAVSDQEYGLYKQFSKTCEAWLNRIFVRGAKLKRRGKACVRSSMVTSIGWAKLTLQREWGEDPIAKARLNDAQENIKNIDGLHIQMQNEGQSVDKDLLKAKLESEVMALSQQVEVVKRKGLVLDKLHAEDVIILDNSVQDFDGYQESRAMAHRLWLPDDEFVAKFGFTPEESVKAGMGSPRSYDKPKGTSDAVAPSVQTNSQPGKPSGYQESTSAAKRWYQIFEIWDHEHNLVHTWAEGMDCWAKISYAPVAGDHWYCFFPIIFNPVDGSFYGMSDVELLVKLQEEYDNTRNDFAKHRADNLPVRVVREGGNLSPTDVGNIVNRKSNDIIVVKGGGGQPLAHDIQVMDNPPIDPANYDTLPIRTDIELISGASDAANGAVQKAKTATEASYLQEGLASRTSERQDALEDWVREMAVYALQIGIEAWSLEEVQSICGQDAVWPSMDKEASFDKVNIEVRAGSSGKPNSREEREQWTELMPVLKDAIGTVAELRQTGQEDMAKALIEMVKETFRRFDERIDIDNFFPRAQENDPEQELAQCKQQLMQAQQQLQLLQEEYDKVKGGEYSKVEAEKTKQAKEFASVEAEKTRQQEVTQNGIMEKQKIESDERVANFKAAKEIEIIRFRVAEETAAKKELAKYEADLKHQAEMEQINSNERMAQHKATTDAKSSVDVAHVGAEAQVKAAKAAPKPEKDDSGKETDKKVDALTKTLEKMMADADAKAKESKKPVVKTVELTGPKGMKFTGKITTNA